MPEIRALPRGMVIRPGGEADEFGAFEAMRRAMGHDMTWSHHAATRHHLRTTPGGSFHVAEEVGLFGRSRIIGYARAIVRDSVWNLTEFFLHPDHQRKGIGGALLDACLTDGERLGASTRYILASYHPAADALYMRRAGCFPLLPMLLMAGPAKALHAPPNVSPVQDAAIKLQGTILSNAFLAEPICPDPNVQGEIDALDREVVGYSRPAEHGHWLALCGGSQGTARLFRHAPGGPLLGYAYFGTHATGPVLAAEPNMLPAFLFHAAALALRLHADNPFHSAHTDFSLALPGCNTHTLRYLLDCGWRIVFQYQLMASRPFASLDRYVGFNPLYTL